MRRPVDMSLIYKLLNPGPVVLVSSLLKGRRGITPIAWHMPISDDPPVIALEIWKGHFIYKAIEATGDFVINIPSSDMVDVVRSLGSVSAAKVDKFAKYNLRPEAAKKVKSPRLKAAIAVIECKLARDERLFKKYGIVIGKAVYAEAEESVFSDRWHPEKSGPKIMQHLGSRIFAVAERLA